MVLEGDGRLLIETRKREFQRVRSEGRKRSRRPGCSDAPTGIPKNEQKLSPDPGLLRIKGELEGRSNSKGDR